MKSRAPEPTSAGHRQVFVKVNAPVDEGVAPLVAALSEIPGLETIESCQGRPDGAGGWVLFRYGTWQDCGRFLFDGFLPSLPPDVRGDVSLSVEAYDARTAVGRISVLSQAIPRVTDHLRSLISADRTSRC